MATSTTNRLRKSTSGSNDSTETITSLEGAQTEAITFIRSFPKQTCTMAEVIDHLGAEADGLGIIESLEERRIVEMSNGRCRITSKSENNIPLTDEEREEFELAERHISLLVEKVEDKQRQIARYLRDIRNGKLYRERFRTFEEYVEDRFGRSRAWAYKLIHQLSVEEGLIDAGYSPNAEALRQCVSARDIQALMPLKSRPDELIKAIRKADEVAVNENRKRSTTDVRTAVQSLKSERANNESHAQAPVLCNKQSQATQPMDHAGAKGATDRNDTESSSVVPASWRVDFHGVNFDGQTCDDLSALFIRFASWLKQNPVRSEFTIEVHPES